MTRRKWFRLGIWLAVLLVLAGVGIWLASYTMLRRTPEWYQPDLTSSDEKNKAANAFEDVLRRFANWTGKPHPHPRKPTASEQVAAAKKGVDQDQAMLAQKPDEAFHISFTDDQLNAFFNKWANTNSRREWFERYVQDPRLVIRDKQLILVGKTKDSGLVISLVFQPRLEPNGDLNMNLIHVFGGILPMPDAVWSGQRTSIENTLKSRLPTYQQTAIINPDGSANANAGSAAMNQLLLATLSYKPTSAVIFVPLDINFSRNLPVKITDFTIHDHTLDMTAEQMSEEEREAYLKRLKQVESVPTPPE